MATGYFLLDTPNPKAKGPDGPYRFHGYIGRNAEVTCGVLHVAVTAPSTESAEAVANYLATTERQASYHTLVDSDGALPLIPTTGTAFHVVGFNSPTVGLSFACHTDTWQRFPAWSRAAYAHAAPVVADWSDRYGLPLRFITRSQAKAGVKGWTFHATMDPDRRSDPGAPPFGQFDINHLFDLARAVGSGDPEEEDDMSKLVQAGKHWYHVSGVHAVHIGGNALDVLSRRGIPTEVWEDGNAFADAHIISWGDGAPTSKDVA